jgi:CheY-like chemotaxis protein
MGVKGYAVSASLNPERSWSAVARTVGETETSSSVLIVDDFEDIRMLLRMQLEMTGRFSVVGEAGDGIEAIEMATALHPDVVLLDLTMPRMDGMTALPLLRSELPEATIIVLSAFGATKAETEALTGGANRYVEKTIGLNLAGVIDELRAA